MRKVALIISVSLIVAILGSIVFLGLYPMDFSYGFSQPELIEVNGWTGQNIDSEKIFDELTKNSSQSILTSVFNKTDVKDPTISKNYSLKNFTSINGIVVTLRWKENDLQVLKLNGENYVDPSDSSKNQIKYRELRCEITENCKDIMLKFYVMDLTQKDRYIYTIEQFGDYSNLYSYLTSLNLNQKNT